MNIVLKNLHLGQILMSLSSIMATVLLCSYIFICNQAYYRLYLTYHRTEQFMQRMAYRIESCEGFQYDILVAIYGDIKKLELLVL